MIKHQSYLTDQFMDVNGDFSTHSKVKFGVLQSFILGPPVLFLYATSG